MDTHPILHTYHDGSRLRIMSAKTLIQIPIWKGNRCRDFDHIAALKKDIGTDFHNLDSGYHIIKYNEPDASGKLVEQAYIIDGQHRASVLEDVFKLHPFERDFDVTYKEVNVENEADAIAYFNRINNVKPIHFKEDPILIVNRYIEEIAKAFPGKKGAPLLRDKPTSRPYLATQRLREALIENVDKLHSTPTEFVALVMAKNTRMLLELEIEFAQARIAEKLINIVERTIEHKFALAYDAKLKWIDEILA
jgi:hypothetical protein